MLILRIIEVQKTFIFTSAFIFSFPCLHVVVLAITSYNPVFPLGSVFFWLENSLQFSFCVDLLVMKALRFCLSKKYFYFAFNFESCFCCLQSSRLSVILYKCFNDIIPRSLAPLRSIEKSETRLICAPLKVMSFLSVVAFKFFLCLCLQCMYHVWVSLSN